MPSRLLEPPPPPPPPFHHTDHRLVPTLAGSAAAGFSLIVLLSLCFRRLSKKRTVPSSDTESKQPRRFSYSSLRRATSSFSPTLRLGQGGSGSVFRGTLKPNLEVAVKVMDSGSLQGEREFQNELSFAGKIDSKYVVSIVGFSSSRRRRRMLLVYELLANGSLQDCLLHRKCAELMDWKKRFSIALDIARGLEYLHHFCDPPIIHVDVKPSNILLDSDFKAKISDFGLSRLKIVGAQHVVEVKEEEEVNLRNGGKPEDTGSVLEETESVATAGGFDGFDGGTDQSPESGFLRVEASPDTVANELDLSPEAAPVVSPRTVAAMASPTDTFDKTSVSDGNFDRVSVVSAGEVGTLGDKRSGRKKKSFSGKDWWWKQDNVESDSGVVRDYVKEWIGNEIKKERPKSDWIGTASSSGTAGKKMEKEKKKNRRRFDWWASLEDDKDVKKKNRRPAREWWREEYSEELARKKKKKKKLEKGSTSDGGSENWWPMDDELYAGHKKRSHSRRSSKSSMDRWLDGLSSDLWRARRNSHDSVSGEIPMSGGVSSTPSMRGTVCYTAPEFGCGGDLSEKCDVYSYGVLLLVLIAGRRPLQVTGSPMSEFQRGNLLSWAKRLGRSGKLLDLVDQSVHSLDKDQALLCITVALLCLQKSPARRPSMQQVVGILLGEQDSPQLPIEFSPSPASRNPYKSRKKV